MTNPPSPETQYQRAVQAASQGNYQFAQMILRELLLAHPHIAKAHHLMATTLMREGKQDQALKHAKMASEINPANAASRWVLGICLSSSGELSEAITQFRAGCELAPGDPHGWTNLGNALLETRQYAHAETALRRGLALTKDLPQLANALAWALWNMGRADEALDVIRAQLERTPSEVPILALRALLSLYSTGATNEDMRLAHVALGQRVEAMTPLNPRSVPHPTPADAERALRVGFVSPDLYGHSVSRFLEPILAHCDHARLLPALYSCHHKRDEISGRLENMSGLWCDIFKVGDHIAAAEIRKHGLDIIIDLAGHTPLNRSMLMCHRPAPVTMTYLGYPHSTGYTRIDYRIVDSITDPPGESDSNSTEKLLRLDPCFLCFTPAIDPPEVGTIPEDPAAPIVFGTFNNAAKLSPRILEIWSRILKAEPASRLLLKSYQFEDAGARTYVLESFKRLQIDPARIELAGQIPITREHLLAYHRMHIALDTFPYHGTTTTCEALLMGTPVITLAGDSHRSRVGASLLSAVGLTDWIACTPEEYVEKAVALARDRAALAMWRRTLRERMKTSVLMDGPGFFDRFERLLRGVWRQKCAAGAASATKS